MRALKFWSLFIGSLLIATVLVGAGWVRSSLPRLSGEVTLKGPSAAITIARDKRGIPHIGGASDNDLYFAMGYVHAQDRLWQMEMNRRIGHGRVAEILGKDGVAIDKYFRTLGFSKRAASAYAALDASARESLATYAAGVNAYLAHHKGALPPEFLLTGIRPEPWQPVDTLVWQKLMWLDLSSNMRTELARAQLLTKLTPTQVQSIYPTYPGDKEPPLPELAALYEALPLADMSSMIGPEKPEGYGSNNWVVDGSRTVSGKPLLANDPHLGLTTPSIWYLVRLHNRTTGSNLVGVGFPGTPSIILGRNDRIAWGYTNTAPDSQDLFIEKLVADGKQYLTPEGPADFIVRRERIKVKGGDDIVLDVRETRHGPVVTDIIGNQRDFLQDGHVLALQWTALQETDSAVSAMLALAHAKSFEEFKAAGTQYFGPEQNMIYADTAGNIGYYAPALVPVRHPDNEIMGRLPSPGWDAKYDWQGFIPYDELPTRFNPEGGIIATANEKIVDGDYPHFITRDWAKPYRGNRIRAQLEATEKHDLDSFDMLHSDITSDMARDLMPAIAANLRAPDSFEGLLDGFGGWTGEMMADQPYPLIFHTFLRHYQEALMADELGELYDGFRRLRPRLLKSSLYWSANPDGDGVDNAYYALPVLDKEVSLAWCDSGDTGEAVEQCTDLAQAAFEKAIEDLVARHGADWQAWQWGDEHILHQSHRPMSQVPFLKGFFEISTPISGSGNTINVAGVSQNTNRLHQSTFGPSYRGIFDLSDLDNSLYTHPTGQSGNPMSAHYEDLFPMWLSGDYFTISTKKIIPDDTRHLLTLVPTNANTP